jgi:phosphoglycerate dehydrogenase-like enzyme
VGEPVPWCRLDDPGAGEATVWWCAGPPPQGTLVLPNLRWIQSGFAGVDDWSSRPEWRERVRLTRTVGDYPERIAQHVFAYALARALDLPEAFRQMDRKLWRRWTPGSLWASRLLIVGMGAIGRTVASVGRGLGLSVSAVRRRAPTSKERTQGFVSLAGLPAALARADWVVNLLPLTAETEEFWNEARFGAMRQGATFISVSRGATVDERALRRGLDARTPGFAILDVFREEPLPAAHWMRSHASVWVTPHIAGVGTVEAMGRDFAENWMRYRSGRALRHVVDRGRGY